MNKKKISQLPLADALTGAELIEVVQGGVNKKTTSQDVADLGSGPGALPAYTKVTSNNYEILSTEYVLSVNNGASNWDVLLPSPVGITGKIYIIKRFDDTSTGQIIISTAAGLVQEHSGAFSSQVVISALFATGVYKLTLISNGTDWELIQK